MSPRQSAALALVVLGGLLVLTVALTTPWRPLGGAAADLQVDALRDFSAAEVDRERAFHRAVRPPALAALGVGLIAATVLGLSPLGARLVGAVSRVAGGRWPVTVVLGVLALTVTARLVRLPLAVRAESARRRFGLSTHDWWSWTVDVLKSTGLTVALLSVAMLGLYAAMRRSPDRWWAWTSIAAAGLVVVVSFGYPLLVEPVFNRFTSLQDGELRESLLELARRDSVDVDDVLVADASRRTTALNAYVSGIGATRRIVVYDTLLESATPDEVRLVVAHELGHVAEDDVRDGTLVGALGAAAAMPLLFLILGWAPLRRLAGVERLGDPRSLALVLLAIVAVTTVSSPVQLLVSRRVEARADVHSLDLTRDPVSFVATERRLAVANLSDLYPNPVLRVLFASHPSAPERIALAREWARRAGVPEPPGQAP